MRDTLIKRSIPDRKFPDVNSSHGLLVKKNATQPVERNVESEMRYRRIFETARDGILILDFDTSKIIDANPFMVKMLNYTLGEIIGKKLWEIGLFGNQDLFERAFTDLSSNGFVYVEEMPIQLWNGNITEVEFISSLYFEDGIKLIQCNIREIRERKTSENSLKAGPNKFRMIVENSPDAIFIADENGRFIYTNKAVTDLLGYSTKEMQDKSIKDLAPKNKIRTYSNFFKEARDKGKLFTELELIKKDGNPVSTDYHSVLLPGNMVYASCRDISNRKQAEFGSRENEQIFKTQNTDYYHLNKENAELITELNKSINHIKHIKNDLIKAKEKAEESDHLNSAFLANMSHEILTPVNVISGFSGFLLEPELSKEKLTDYVHAINANTKQLLSNLGDILDISKITVGQFKVESELVSINKLMRDLFITYRKLVDFNKLQLIYSPQSTYDLSQIKTDGNRIRQIICNLLNNALKFTKEGEIEFGYTIKKKFIEFYVRDTGIGISREYHSDVFQIFRQIGESKNREDGSNGLGLAISKALVEKLGGTISMDSEPGKGSLFIFSIPYKNEFESIDNLNKTSGSEQLNWEDKTVLIVEDEVYNHAYLQEMLSEKDVKMLHAWDGKMAVELVKTNPQISLVLMDIKMPVMDGNESMRLIKKIRPTLPVIAQTAYAHGRDSKNGLEAGFDSFLIKPVDRNLLLEVIKSHLV